MAIETRRGRPVGPVQDLEDVDLGARLDQPSRQAAPMPRAPPVTAAVRLSSLNRSKYPVVVSSTVRTPPLDDRGAGPEHPG